MVNDYLTTKQAAEDLGLEESHIRRLCGQGIIEGAVRVGGRWLIPSPVQYKRLRAPKGGTDAG